MRQRRGNVVGVLGCVCQQPDEWVLWFLPACSADDWRGETPAGLLGVWVWVCSFRLPLLHNTQPRA